MQDVLVNVAPKRANWDLKRDIEKKLDKLERRTQRAMLEMMQVGARGGWLCAEMCGTSMVMLVETRC